MALKFEVSNKTLAAWTFFVAFLALMVAATKFGIVRPAYGAAAVEGGIALLLGVTLVIEGAFEGKIRRDFGTYVILGVATALVIYGLIAILGTVIPTIYDSGVGVLFAIGFGAVVYEMFKK